MAATQANQNEQDQKQDLTDQLKRSVSNAYAFVVGQQTTESFSAVTFEELLDRQIERIEGPGTALRPNVLDRIDKVKSDMLAAIEEIKKQPDDFFRTPDPQVDAVTPPEVEDPLDKILG